MGLNPFQEWSAALLNGTPYALRLPEGGLQTLRSLRFQASLLQPGSYAALNISVGQPLGRVVVQTGAQSLQVG